MKVKDVPDGFRVASVFLKTCDREPGIIFHKEIACGIKQKQKEEDSSSLFFTILVVMRHTCQVTNQSSQGELSFHHNPPPCLQGLVPLDFSRYSERRHKIEKCSSPFILSFL